MGVLLRCRKVAIYLPSNDCVGGSYFLATEKKKRQKVYQTKKENQKFSFYYENTKCHKIQNYACYLLGYHIICRHKIFHIKLEFSS